MLTPRLHRLHTSVTPVTSVTSAAQAMLTPRDAPSFRVMRAISTHGLTTGLIDPVRVVTYNQHAPSPPLGCQDDDVDLRHAAHRYVDPRLRRAYYYATHAAYATYATRATHVTSVTYATPVTSQGTRTHSSRRSAARRCAATFSRPRCTCATPRARRRCVTAMAARSRSRRSCAPTAPARATTTAARGPPTAPSPPPASSSKHTRYAPRSRHSSGCRRARSAM